MSKYVVQPFTKPSYDLSYFMNFSPDRLKAVALMAEVGLPLYKIHHSIVIGDVALLIADGVEKLEGVKVDRYVFYQIICVIPMFFFVYYFSYFVFLTF